jgi:D-xylose transport system substrate-binding protein
MKTQELRIMRGAPLMSFFACLVLGMVSLGWANPPTGGGMKKVRIGLSMDTLKEERWQRDRDLFVKKAEALGAQVLVQAANGNDALQNSQAENLLTQGVDVLVVVPHNGVTAGSIVKAAHAAGKKVISYDRLIQHADVDLYLSFDNVEVGRLQGQYLVEHAPRGNYVLIGGAPTDNNAKMLREGQMKALKPLIDRGEIKIVSDQWAKEWQASEALKHTENALSKAKNDVVAILASNDGTAGGVISALKQQKLDGKVLVTGQDADLAACQRIAEGSQTMTIYKPISMLAEKAAEIAVAMARGETVKTNTKVPNGKIEVPAVLLVPQVVDSKNMESTILKDGFHRRQDVFKNVAKK